MRLWSTLRSSFVAGVALVAPLAVTLFALQLLVGWVTSAINPLVQGTRLAQYTANYEVVAQLLAIVLIAIAVALLGYFAQRSSGERLFALLDRGIGVVPLVRVIYSSVRQVSTALLEQSDRFESVVLVEYPRDGVYALGFITGDSPEPVGDITGEQTYNVYMPNSPNPTGGRLIMVPESRVHDVDISVRRGVRLIVTTGIEERQEEIATLAAESETSAA
ncbi:DUF502 domain-containing protein [Halorientalis litorea]|jgi:uncharacterized membrane protein|uniref:DUF502 domain-containing protein n=1 Tax=Halorientalis litorea TaxID=2931977 RepID=UPI001FF1A40F|nr:DUF502 domain-containing protein [Halorientalis litorea]